MHYFIIAGEASGDLHGSELISALRRHDSDARFSFLGGDMMAAAAGTQPLIHYRHMAFMGFSEVLRNLGAIGRNLRTARRAIVATRPDCLILIDYPSFNLKVAATAAKAGIPVYYYISPKVWAWKQWRVRTIRRLVRRLYAIFPFEVAFYRKHGMDVDYVGNPSVEEIDRRIAAAPDRADFLARHNLRDRPLIALLPGSRRGEIRCNLPVMVEAVRHFPQYRAVVAAAPGIDDDIYSAITDLPVVRDATTDLLVHARAALVTSGTATLEAALTATPQVVCYRSNGSKLAFNIMRRLVKVDFVSLPNLIAEREVIPELLLHMCTPDEVTRRLGLITSDKSAARAEMLAGYDDIRRRLGSAGAADRTASLLTADLISYLHANEP